MQQARKQEPIIHKRVTRPLGTRYPIIQGGMQWVGVAALQSGEVDGGVITAGQCIGLIRDVPTCAAQRK